MLSREDAERRSGGECRERWDLETGGGCSPSVPPPHPRSYILNLLRRPCSPISPSTTASVAALHTANLLVPHFIPMATHDSFRSPSSRNSRTSRSPTGPNVFVSPPINIYPLLPHRPMLSSSTSKSTASLLAASSSGSSTMSVRSPPVTSASLPLARTAMAMPTRTFTASSPMYVSSLSFHPCALSDHSRSS